MGLLYGFPTKGILGGYLCPVGVLGTLTWFISTGKHEFW